MPNATRLRLISWNLNGRARHATAQVAALIRERPDAVALQEVTRRTLPLLRAELSGAGLEYIVDSFALAPVEFEVRGPRRYGQLTASRHPLEPEQPGRFSVCWPERILSAKMDVGSLGIELHNTHVPPGSSNGWTKIAVLDAIYSALAVPSTGPRILCGDFNTPRMEFTSGEVITWGQQLSREGSWRVMRSRYNKPGADWDRGERRVLVGLAEYDLVDVFRAVHGYQATDSSWFLRRGGREIGRRFDHVFASRSLAPKSCRYLHALREAGLSDHSPIEATLELTALLAPAAGTNVPFSS